MSNEKAYVVSDLHLGGRTVEPELEDFDQDEELEGFVDRIARPGVSLFINGDFIDFPQIPPYPAAPADAPHLLWDEDTALQKLEHAFASHPKPFDALARFLAKGGALHLHTGNHDLELGLPGVQDRMRQRLSAAPTARLTFASAHNYHGVHIEHGHLWAPENATKKGAPAFHEHGGKRYVERVWGTDLMLRFYNDLERRHPFADNVKPMVALLWHGVKNRWVRGKDVVHFVMSLKNVGVVLSAIGSVVLDESAPPPESVAIAFEDEAWQKAILERLAADPEFAADVKSEIGALSPEQRAIWKRSTAVTGNLGDPSLGVDRGEVLGLFRDDREVRAAKERLQAGAEFVVFGHTHERIDGLLNGKLWNPGTWLPKLDLKSREVKEHIKKNGVTLDLFKEARFYVKERTVVEIARNPPFPVRVSMVIADSVAA